MRTMLFLLLFFGMSCLLLTSDSRSLLKSALRFVEAQVQQAKEHLVRINPSYRNNQKCRRKQPFSAVTAASSIGRDSKKNELLLMQLRSKLSRSIKKRTKFVAIFAIAIIAGHEMSSQLAAQVPTAPSQPLTSLKTVPIPGPSPSELAVYVKDKKTAIMLGKSLF